jgi:subtilisin family serine protease
MRTKLNVISQAVALLCLASGSINYAQAQCPTPIFDDTPAKVTVAVIKSYPPTIKYVTNSNTVTHRDGSVVTTPVVYTITSTPQDICTYTYEVIPSTKLNGTTKADKKLIKSEFSKRIHPTQTGKTGTPITVSGPTKATTSVAAVAPVAFTGGNFSAASYYKDPNMGTPTVVPSSNPADYLGAEANNKAVTIVNANAAYARGWTGKGSTVLVMDSGIVDHADLKDKVKYSRDYTNTSITDTNGHGTHVAGIVAANRNGAGMHGIAYDANLAIAKITTGANFSMNTAQNALKWASEYQDIVVANLSANVMYSPDYLAAMKQVKPGIFENTHKVYGGSKYYNLETPQGWNIGNMVLVISAGNSKLDYVQNPAVFAAATDAAGKLVLGGKMLVVGNWNAGLGAIEGAKSGHVCKDFVNNACNDRYKISDFYILAPGMAVKSTSKDGVGYQNMSGTSQAAPVVAGAVAIISQLWPYMTPDNQAKLLLKTANKNLPGYSENTHGQGLLDLDRATQPVGALAIPTSGRTGSAVPIGGSLSLSSSVGSLQSAVSSVAAVDDFKRDFQVNLASAVASHNLVTNPVMLQHRAGQSWSAKLAGIYSQQFQGFALGQSVQNASVSLDSRAFGSQDETVHQFTMTQTAKNPYVNFTGMWGEVNSSTMFEYNATWTGQTGMWAQGGVIRTNTNINRGLVQNVSPMYSVHAVAGYTKNNVSVYAGLQPKVIAGSVNLRLPSSTDADGVMSYSDTSVKMQGAKTVSYLGASADYIIDKQQRMSFNTAVSTIGASAGVNYQVRF